MIAAYVRVSSNSQKLATQRHAIMLAVRARRVRIDRWYADKVSSRLERPELNRLKNDVQAGRISKLYVYKLDRLSRGGIPEVFNLVKQFREHGCIVSSITEPFGFEGPAGDMVLAVLAWAAQMELTTMRDRISAARKRVEASGGSWGRPRRTTVKQLQLITRLRSKGKSLRAIAIAVKIPYATVYRELCRKPETKQISTKGGKMGSRKLAAGVFR